MRAEIILEEHPIIKSYARILIASEYKIIRKSVDDKRSYLMASSSS